MHKELCKAERCAGICARMKPSVKVFCSAVILIMSGLQDTNLLQFYLFIYCGVSLCCYFDIEWITNHKLVCYFFALISSP